MRPYPAYKDSGVEWLGEVPEGWEVVPVKAVASCNDETLPEDTDPELEIEYVEISGVDANAGIVETTATKFGPAPSRARRIIRHGDVLISTVRTYLRAIAQAVEPAPNLIASTGFAVLRPKAIDSGFLGYACRAEYFISEVISRSVGVSYPAINASQIGTLAIPLPPLPEQQTIARFLDKEVAKIDALVAEQRRLIALLAEKRQAVISHAVTKGLNPATPLKPSGIDWLGDIPEGWEVVRLGNLFREVAETGNDNLPILSVSIHRGVSNDEIAEEDMERKVSRSEDKSKYVIVRPDDLTYNMMRAWQGGFGAVQVLGMVSPAYVVARPISTERQVTQFIELMLRTQNAVTEMKRHSKGVTDFRLRLYWDEFKTICVALPPRSEQKAILSEIKRITDEFDALSTTATSAISLLQERRAALISAAVTGKIDLRPHFAQSLSEPESA